MKKETEIIIPAVSEKTKKITTYVCDLCFKEDKDSSKFKTCDSCQRLACYYWEGDRCIVSVSDEWGSDYPDRYCKICYELKFEKYALERQKIEEDYESIIEQLDTKIKTESLGRLL